MQNVSARISFTLTSDKGDQLHKTTLEYAGLDELRVLFLEKHLIGFLSNLNAEAAEDAALRVTSPETAG